MTYIVGLPLVTLNLNHHIGGEFIEPSKQQFAVINPANEEQIAMCSEGTVEDVDAAVAAAKKAFYHGYEGYKAWKYTPGSERKQLLEKLASLVERDADLFAKLDTLNLGAPLHISKRFISMASDWLRYLAGWADRITGDALEPIPAPMGPDRLLVITTKQPFGVTAGICPWNGPALMFIVKVAQALSTGNTIVMKDSEKTPLAASHIMKLIVESGFPPGVVNLVHGFGQPVGEALALHMDIRKISFTGSGATGRTIMMNSARSNLKSVTLELGGKSAAIIFQDANLQTTVPKALMSILINSGQVCTAHSRIYVQETILDEFLQAFKQAFAAWASGDPTKEGIMGGPLVDAKQYERVKGYLELAKTEAKIIVGGGVIEESKGYYIQPTILIPNSNQVSVVKEEIFGPVVCILPFKTEQEAISKANDSEYGLSGGVYTESLSRGIRVAQELETGSVGVNSGMSGGVRSPFGGFKQSGIGREVGSAFIDNWTESKTITIAF